MGMHETILPLDKCKGHTHTRGALKLTDFHVYPTFFSKMKVSHTGQVLRLRKYNVTVIDGRKCKWKFIKQFYPWINVGATLVYMEHRN